MITAVVGAGSWGTALAMHLARIGHKVQLCARDAALVARMCETRENADYLPGLRLPDNVHPTHEAAAAVAAASMIVWAVIFGFVVFGDVPSWATIIGAAIIIAAGLYIFVREQQLGRTDSAINPPA